MPDAIHSYTNELYRGLTKIGLFIGIAILPSVAYACKTSYPRIVPLTIPQSSIIAPARDAPLITPLSAWATSTLSPAYTQCSTTTMTYFYIGMNSDGGATRVGYYLDPSDGINYPIWAFPGSSVNDGVGFIAGGGSNSTNITPINFYARYTLYEAKIPSATEPVFVKIRLMRYAPISLTKITYGYINWVGFVVSYFSPDRFNNVTNAIAGVTFTSNNQTWTISPGSAAASCSVSTQNLQVNLPAIEAKQLSSVATTGNTPFTLWVNCPSTTPVNVYMTLTDNNNRDQTNSTVISAASGSSASGVGVQISDQYGQPITLGPDSSMAGNPGQFLVRSNLTGSIPIPFTASYIRTGAIKPGTLKAVATFTMSYQ